MNWTDYRNKILAAIDTEAYYMDELKNIDRRGTELKAECPFKHLHESSTDNTPSLTVNLATGVFVCQTCKSKGNVHTMHKYLYGLSNEDAWFELGDALKIERPDNSKPTRPDIEVGLVAAYHSTLMSLTGPIREVLQVRRGYTDATLKHFQLGWNGERVTIPIYDENNTLVNFRCYKWNSDDDKYKVINYTDEVGNTYGEVRIFGIENLLDASVEEIVWCEGETDRILSEQNGFPTACPTSGAGSWRPEWTKLFRTKKRVYLCQDNDEAGRIATAKLCEMLYRVVDVYIIQWPEDFPNKGDITDFYTKCNQTAADFRKLMDNAIKYVDPKKQQRIADEGDAEEVHLAVSANAALYGKKLRIPVMVAGKDGTPYICPKKIKFSCGYAAGSDDKKCSACDLALAGGETTLELSSNDKSILNMIKCTDKQQAAAACELCGINQRCKSFTMTVEEYMNLEEVRMIPKAEANFGFSKDYEYVVRTGLFIGDGLKTNARYTMAGYMHPDPHSQYANYVFDNAIPDKDLISEFDINDDVVEQLKIFQPAPGQSIEDKFNEIQTDFERNVTRIWERRDVGVATDLIYHTVLNFYFQEQFVKRGWGELLIIGDSGQAKTTLVERIMEHYRLGELLSGESSKRTGLVYSVQQTNKRWFLVWGAFPLNDGGLITLDELSGINEDDLAVMSDVRSSGIAKATGVITAETTARTRCIYISNPRNGRQLNTETFGVSAVLKLFGKTEDVRRLDLAMAVASGDVDPELINKAVKEMPTVKHVYTSDACNMRVLWAWSRRPDDIVFEPEATTAILRCATEMGKKYTSKIPIVEAADQRIKIARLAVSCACCMFSTDSTYTKVIVKEEHVQFVVDFMNRVYSTKAFGYDKLSVQEATNNNMSNENLTGLRNAFLLLPVPDFNELIRTLYALPYFNRNTLEDYTGLPRDELKSVLKFLTTKNVVERVKGDYRRQPLGTEFLEYLINEPITKEEIDTARKNYYNEY